jgi:hypothetical protein
LLSHAQQQHQVCRHFCLQDVFTPPPAPAKPRVASSVTVAHRPELFRRSWHSFKARCLDCHEYGTTWFAVDDGSSPDVLAQMQRDAPPGAVTWLAKAPQEAGHVGSLNRILAEVEAQGFDYLLHLVSVTVPAVAKLLWHNVAQVAETPTFAVQDRVPRICRVFHA